ncbi:MAG TPA: PEGA domain-containing protein [Vicinamibacteria bacterium]|nr:PEGA domain-containing protein [Vicinamibacteria bacterium]
MAHRKALAALSLVAVAGLAVLTPSTADAQPRGRIRGRVVVGGFYDPFYFSPFYSPFGFGYGYGWGGYPYAAYGPYGYGRSYDTSGSARIQVTPKEAEVYVDGYRAGRVDDFDGTFQRLNVRPGPHEITLYLPGYRTLTERVYIGEGSTMKLKQSLEKLAPGETSTPPPAPPKEERRTRGRRAAGDDRDDRDDR